MREKDSYWRCFFKKIAMIKNEFGKAVKVIRSDNES